MLSLRPLLKPVVGLEHRRPAQGPGGGRAWGGRRAGVAIGAALLLAGSGGAAEFRLGTNLAEVTDYSAAIPFLDVFKMAREWFTANATTFDTQEAHRLDLDANGWIRSLTPLGAGAAQFDRACTLIFSMAPIAAGSQQGRLPYPAGAYVVRYEGEGTLEYRLAARKNEAASSPGRDVIEVQPAEPGIQICITATRAGNPLRNVRVYLPGTEEATASGRFNPDFLARLRPYAALRFMDWMRTNNSTQRTTAERPRREDYVYTTEKGVPLEVMVDLANTLEAEPWFTLPQPATDEYVSSFASAVRARLAPGRAVYVEYSNEIWNDQFEQGRAIEREGVAKFAARPGSDYDRRLNRHGERSAEICTLWRSAFGAEAARVRCVMAGQAVNPYIVETALDCAMSPLAPCTAQGFYGLAIAPYFGDWVGQPQFESTVTGWTRTADGGLARLFNELETGTELNTSDAPGGLNAVLQRISSHAELARLKGLRLLAYEGGQHLVGVEGTQENGAINTLFDAANRDARMGALYTRYLEAWRTRGGALFMHFNDTGNASRYGRWGALEIQPQTASPKYNALVAAISGCLFDWAETVYPQFFAPARSPNLAFDPYLYRSYAATGNYLATSSVQGHVWVLGPSFGAQPLDVGLMTPFLVAAGCR